MRLFAAIITTIVIGAGAGTWALHGPQAPCVVDQWLADLRCGGEHARSYWEPGVKPATLYAVQSYEIVGPNPDGFWVRIHSSTYEGLPIVRLYAVCVRNQKIYAIIMQGQVERLLQNL